MIFPLFFFGGKKRDRFRRKYKLYLFYYGASAGNYLTKTSILGPKNRFQA